MLLRRVGERLAISQPHHAWISGELARAWGNASFALPEPREAVICGTALHDIGWLDWERAPRLDAATGLPVTFPALPALEHAPMWRRGVELARAYGAIPTLIVARHGESIYERFFDPAKAPSDAVAAVRDFLEWQSALCAATVERLAANPATAAWVDADNLAFMKAFVAALDAFSLHLCGGIAGTASIENLPCRAGSSTTLTLSSKPHGAIIVDPWPFRDEEVRLAIEGRHIQQTYRDQTALDAAFDAAPTAVIETVLERA